MQKKKREVPGIQSVEVGGRLLAALVSLPEAQTLTNLAKAAGMPPTKARRYLVSYIRVGLARQDQQTGQYDLGPLALQMGLASLGRLDIVKRTSPVLSQIRDRTGETVALSVWSGSAPTFVSMEDSGAPVALVARIGIQLPLLTTATGLVFAAFLPERLIGGLIEQEKKRLPKRIFSEVVASHGSTDGLLSHIRHSGYADSESVFQPGIRGISAPIFNSRSEITAAITILMQHRRTSHHVAPMLAVLKEATSRLSKEFGATDL